MANCEVCGNPEESIRHVLLECSVAKEFWFQVRQTTGIKIPQLNSATWASDLLQDTWPARRAQEMTRNKRRHQEMTMSLQQLGS